MQSRIQELKSLQGVQLEHKYNHLKDNLGAETENYEEYETKCYEYCKLQCLSLFYLYSLVLLSKIASRWESSRQEKGALNLESSEVQFEFQVGSNLLTCFQ